MRRAHQLSVLLLGLGLAPLPLTLACGGEPRTPATVEEADEQKAARLLVRAEERKNEEDYRKILERFPASSAAQRAGEGLSRLLIVQAESALASGDHATAEQKSEEARRLGGLEVTERARKVLDAVDDHRAERTASEASKLGAEGRCAAGLEVVALSVGKKARDRFKKALFEQSRKALVDCLVARLEAEVRQGNTEAARALLQSREATDGLSPQAYQEVDRALQKMMIRTSLGAIEPMLKKRDWTAAVAKLASMKEANELSEREHAAAVEVVQDAVRAYLQEYAVAARLEKSPVAARKSIDAQLAAVGIQQPPADLVPLLEVLAVAEECERVGCKMNKRAAVAWAWGDLDVKARKSATQGAKVETLPHAKKFFVLGRSGAHALVALEDPGPVKPGELFEKALGWVATDRLRSTDTFLWLPPPDQAAGFRVWGPLRPPAKDYHLGTVVRVEGDRAMVKRMADSEEVQVSWRDLRAGRVPRGLKVMAFCIDELHPEEAKVEGVEVEAEVPKVKVSCTKGKKERVEVGSALVSRADWLHPHRP